MPRMYKKMNKYGIMTYHFSTIPFEYFGPHSPIPIFYHSSFPTFQFSSIPLFLSLGP
jgi:hypothetical protein